MAVTYRSLQPRTARAIPIFVRHLTLRPYRRQLAQVAEHSSGSRLRDAMLGASIDTLFDLLLQGYAELEATEVPAWAGHFCTMFNRVGYAFDDAFEASADSLLTSHELLRDRNVVRYIDELAVFASTVAEQSRVAAGRQLLLDDLEKGFDEYRRLVARSRRETSPELLLTIAALDAGGQLRCLASVLSLLHRGERLTEQNQQDFITFGVLAKLVDDVRDVLPDYQGQRPNLVLAYSTGSPTEYRHLRDFLENNSTPTYHWFRVNAPCTLAAVTGAIQDARASLRSRHIQIATDVMTLAIRWRGVNAQGSSGGRM